MTINPFDNDRLKTRKLREALAAEGQLPANRRDRPTFLRSLKTAEHQINASTGAAPIVLTGNQRVDAMTLNGLFTNDQGSLPEGAVGFIDFTALTYYFEGSTAPIEEVLVGDPDNYMPFDINDVIEGVGYRPNRSAGPKFTGDVAALLLAGATVVIEFSLASADKFIEYYHVKLPDYSDEYQTRIFHTNNAGGSGENTRNFPSGDIAWPNIGAGTHKAAITHAEDEVALSIDGGAADSDTGVWGWAPTDAYIALRGRTETFENPGTIMSIVIYPVRPPADLPALSALS